MNRLLSRVLVLLLLPFAAYGQGAHRISQVITHFRGTAANVLPNAQITVCTAGTNCSSLINIYSDIGLSDRLPNPMSANQNGDYDYYVAVGCVDESISYPGAENKFLDNVCLTSSATVTTFSSGNLSPLFTTSVANPTTSPALSFTLSSAANNTVFGNFSGSSAAPSFWTLAAGTGLSLTPSGSTATFANTGVLSAFGRAGAVVATSGDYSCAQITGAICSTSVSSVFGRSGAVVAATGDYTCTQVTSCPTGAITSLTGVVTASGPGAAATTLTNSGVSAGSYTNASITVGADGRLTAASSGAASTVDVTVADVTSSRTFGTTYHNTSGNAVYVSGNGHSVAGSSTASLACLVGPSSPTLTVWTNRFTATVSGEPDGFQCMVPNNYFYEITATGDVDASGNFRWFESTF